MHGTLTFTRPADVVADEERPDLLRALPAPDDLAGEAHRCELHDLAAAGVAEPGLEAAGFETVDLSGNLALQRTLAAVREADQLSDGAATAIRASLDGARFALGSGTALRVVQVVDDGLFHRRAGPNGLDVNPGGIDGINGHSGARFVHGDQDVFGTPLRQLLDGAAPDMFRHVTPDGRNDTATTFLLNLWIPLHAPVQPLALMDCSTLDARRHQLRYGLPVDGFLERDDDADINDIWNFLYDPGQRWYVRSNMGHGQGYVFNTLGTPHGAVVLPGEDALEEQYLALHRVCEAFERGDADPSRSVADHRAALRPPPDATPTIRDAWRNLSGLHERAGEGDPGEWCAQARAAMDTVVRRSIEMRLVAALVGPS